MIGSKFTRFARATALALMASAIAPAAAQDAGDTSIYRGASVWTGKRFETRDLAVRDGRFVDPRRVPAGTREVSLAGRYVVPAYANAHTHLTPPNEAGSRSFSDVGVFYAWNPNTNIIPLADQAFFGRRDSYDVAISQGGITVRGGHPEKLYSEIIFKGRSIESLAGDAFHYGETPAEIDAALDKLVVQGADFVKAYLIFSEEFAERSGKNVAWGLKGLSPENAAYVVKAARRRGLNTVFHTESIYDLLTAARIGGHAAMHVPGYSLTFDEKTPDKWALTDATARQVARSGMMLVPTYGLIRGFDGSVMRPLEAKQRIVQANNLRLLARHGAKILVGTDKGGEIFSETEHLASLNALPPADLLRIVLETGKHLFPKRRIGCFDTGCEADFLALSADPLADIKALRSITLRIRAGREVAATVR